MAKLISKTYGEALFELAVEENKTDIFMEEILAVRAAIKQNPDLSALMNHPKIVKEEKIQVMENIFKGRVSEELVGFLKLIISKDRYGEIDEILEYFLDKIKEFKGIGVAYVTTPFPLDEIKKSIVEDKLLETTSYNSMEMHFDVDATLIGGMVIRIGDRVVDSTIKTKLTELEKQLLKLQLA